MQVMERCPSAHTRCNHHPAALLLLMQRLLQQKRAAATKERVTAGAHAAGQGPFGKGQGANLRGECPCESACPYACVRAVSSAAQPSPPPLPSSQPYSPLSKWRSILHAG